MSALTLSARLMGHDVREMVRRLSLPAHGALELPAGLVLIAAPFALGFGPTGLVSGVVAGALLAGLGLAEDLAISAHMAADVALAGALAAAAVGLAAAGDDLAAVMLGAAAAAELALTAGTRWTRRR